MEIDLNAFLFGAIVGGTVIAVIATRCATLLQNQRIQAERRFREMNWQACHWATLYAEALVDNHKMAARIERERNDEQPDYATGLEVG